jgi:hypothetical protein
VTEVSGFGFGLAVRVQFTCRWFFFGYAVRVQCACSSPACGFGFAVPVTATITGVQLEAGSVATPFAMSTGTFATELAACQRYYYQSDAQIWTNLQYQSNVAVSRGTTLFLPQFMRVVPTLTFFDSPGTSGKVSVSASSGGYSDAITPNVFGQNSNAYAYYVGGSYVLGYTSKITASAEL